MDIDDDRRPTNSRKRQRDNEDLSEIINEVLANPPKKVKSERRKGKEKEEVQPKSNNEDTQDMLDGENLTHKAQNARRKRNRETLKEVSKSIGVHDGYDDEDVPLDFIGEQDPDFENLKEEEEKAGGVELEAFNMREELGSEGQIDNIFNPRRLVTDEDDEPWLVEHINRMKDSDYADRISRDQTKWQQEEKNYDKSLSNDSLDKQLILNQIENNLLWGETINTALRRLRPNTKKNNNNVVHRSDDDNQDGLPRPFTFEELVDKVDKLVILGVSSIYSMTKEDIIDLIDEEAKKLPKWEYKWASDDTIYGPYSSIEMQEWIGQGYFIVEGHPNPMVRKIITEGDSVNEFVDITLINFEND